MEIIGYEDSKHMTVMFDDGTISLCSIKNFKTGSVRSDNFKSFHGVGYNGVGTAKKNINGKNTPSYNVWRGMIDRCYGDFNTGNNVVYNDCFVCDEWHNFQVFDKWYNENYYQIDGRKMQLDKDILLKGNREYSPQNCVFVPSNINVLFRSSKNRGKYPIGVTEHTANRYRASTINQFTNKKVYLGLFITPELAFYEYKRYKEQHIKDVADYYKNDIPQKLYEAMYKWEVEITD